MNMNKYSKLKRLLISILYQLEFFTKYRSSFAFILKKKNLKMILFSPIIMSLILSCTKFESGDLTQLTILLNFGTNYLQSADVPYALTTIFTNERGAADLDGTGENASFVNLTAIQYYNNTLYLLDNTRKIYPKLKIFNLNTQEITTIGALNTENRPLKDMVLTVDGHFFLATDKLFFFSSLGEVKTGMPSQTVSFIFNENEYSQFSKIKVDTIRKNLYILNNCKVYKLSYLNLPATITLSTSFFTYPGCTFVATDIPDANIDNFALDANESLYVCKNIYLQKKTLSGSFTTLYSNDNSSIYFDLSCHIHKNEIYFVGSNFLVGGVRRQFSSSRLYKINLSNSRVNLLAGGGYSRNGNTKDGIGTFSSFQNIASMTFDPNGNLYFIDNFVDYNATNRIQIQKIRRATKL